MNERMLEIAEQNGFIHKWQPPGEQYEKLQTLEKFAELIVKECAELVKDFYQEDEFTCYNAKTEITKHFGVEE